LSTLATKGPRLQLACVSGERRFRFAESDDSRAGDAPGTAFTPATQDGFRWTSAESYEMQVVADGLVTWPTSASGEPLCASSTVPLKLVARSVMNVRALMPRAVLGVDPLRWTG
jgi:hypothetical protein